MRLGRVGPVGSERCVVFIEDELFVDVAHVVEDYDGAFFSASSVLAELEAATYDLMSRGETHRLGRQRIGSPIARPHQILCVGLNYADHAREAGAEPPSEPIIFNKSPNTLVGPNDGILLPRGSTHTDWEVELGIVIGARCRYLPDPDTAKQHIAGYVLVHDISEREYQLERGGQWVKGKSCESFNPAGPWLLTPDEVPYPRGLDLWLDVNGAPRQRGSTAEMIFDPAHLVHYLSQFMVLEPGDLINTGTPSGVGMGMTPPQYLTLGDSVTLGGTNLGQQRQTVFPAP